MFIFLLPIATALYGGETWSYHFPYCNELRVEIAGELQIDYGEYLILNNCTENSPNYYTCNCTNDYYFNVSFKTNTVNSYIFDFNYDYSKFAEETTPSSGSQRSSGGTFTLRFTNKSRILMLKQFAFSRFWVDGKQHTIRIIEIGDDWVKIEIESEVINITLNLNETKEVQIDNETLRFNLKEIRGRVAFIEFTKIETFIKDEPEIVEIEVEEEISISEDIDKKEEVIHLVSDKGVPDDAVRKSVTKWMIRIIVILLVVIIGLSGYFVYRKSKGSKKE